MKSTGRALPDREMVRALARTLARSRMWADIAPASAPGAVRAAVQHGVNIRSAHRIQARLHPFRTALVDERYSYTYQQLDHVIDRVASALRMKLRLRPGDSILLATENCAPALVIWFAAFRAGIRVAHASFESTEPELRYLAQKANARCIVSSTISRANAGVVARERGIPRLDVDPGDPDRDVVPYDQVTMHPLVRLPATTSAAANVVFTSGTTGKPKGAVRDFSRMGLVEASGILEQLPLQAGERHLTVARLYHAAAQAMILMVTSLGGTNIVCRRFDGASVLAQMHHERITSTFMVPTMIQRLVDLPEESFRRHPVRLHMLLSGAAPFPHALRMQAIRRFGVGAVHDFYGATELGWVTTVSGHDMILRPGTIGRPITGQHVRIVDQATGRTLPTGEVGTLYVRGAQNMEGYIDVADDSIDGWLTVDDLARQDKDGYLYLGGRTRDMIISGGINVYPIEVEQVLTSIPGVHDASVVGLPDPAWGEKVVAFVVTDLDDQTLDQACRASLSGAKRPRLWVRLPELPRNPTGKVLKTALRELLQESHGTSDP